MKHKSVLILAAILTLAVAGAQSAWASKKSSNAVSVAEYLEAQDEIALDIRKGRYGALPEEEIALIHKNQATIRKILKDVDSVESLNKDDKIAAYNAQEAINSVLMDNVQDRPVCRRESSTGTHRKRTVCLTKRERNLMTDKAQETMRFWPVSSPDYNQ